MSRNKENPPKVEDMKKPNLRGNITVITEELIAELREQELTPSEKIAFLKTLLPYAVGKLPTALVNFAVISGQPVSARVIEPTKDGGVTKGSGWQW